MGGRGTDRSCRGTHHTHRKERETLGMVYSGWRVKGVGSKGEFPEFQESQMVH